jgi:hypothetical protein
MLEVDLLHCCGFFLQLLNIYLENFYSDIGEVCELFDVTGCMINKTKLFILLESDLNTLWGGSNSIL